MLVTFLFSSLLYLWYIIQNTVIWKLFIIFSMIFFKIDCGSKSRLILVFCVNGLCYHYITLSFMSVIISHFWDLFVFFSLVLKMIYIFLQKPWRNEQSCWVKKTPSMLLEYCILHLTPSVAVKHLAGEWSVYYFLLFTCACHIFHHPLDCIVFSIDGSCWLSWFL